MLCELEYPKLKTLFFIKIKALKMFPNFMSFFSIKKYGQYMTNWFNTKHFI